MAFRRCPLCGAYLDPGERCDCEEETRPAIPAAEVWGRKKKREPRLVSLKLPASKTVTSA